MSKEVKLELISMGKAAKQAAFQLATTSTAKKNEALAIIADELEAKADVILAANAKDIAKGRDLSRCLSHWPLRSRLLWLQAHQQ